MAKFAISVEISYSFQKKCFVHKARVLRLVVRTEIAPSFSSSLSIRASDMFRSFWPVDEVGLSRFTS
jgi:hypothetical protein